jgi:hypothetical protein
VGQLPQEKAKKTRNDRDANLQSPLTCLPRKDKTELMKQMASRKMPKPSTTWVLTHQCVASLPTPYCAVWVPWSRRWQQDAR